MSDQLKDDLNAIAWRDFVLYAWTQPDAHKAFRSHMGWPQSRGTETFLDAMIDRACNMPSPNEDAYMHAFIDWVTEHHWGADMDPRKSEPPTGTGTERESVINSVVNEGADRPTD